MNILYLGSSNPNSTAYHRAQALVRLGHRVVLEDPYQGLAASLNSKLFGKIHFHTGYTFLQKKNAEWLKKILQKNSSKIDAIWVNGGELFGENCMKLLKSYEAPIILYNNDDPTGGRDGNRFATLLKTLPFYDLCAVMRNINVPEYTSKGAKKVIRVTMSYDEAVHSPFEKKKDIPKHLLSEVAFIGTWMRHEKRDEFLLTLIKNGVPLSIWGDRWNKSPFWKQLSAYYRGGALGGRDYVAAIQGAKICIGMLSKGNRDSHTQRSLEIPYIGGVFCAERTDEHAEMYVEGKEAVFWSDADECVDVCKKLLQNDDLRRQIRLNGMKKVRDMKVGNQDICQKILQELDAV